MKRTSIAVLLLLKRMLPFSLIILAVFAIAAVVPVAAQRQQAPPPPNSECGMNIEVENCIQMRARQAAFARDNAAHEAKMKAEEAELVQARVAQEKAAQEKAALALIPSQPMIDYVQKGLGNFCQTHSTDKAKCVDNIDAEVKSEKFQRFQFLIHDGSQPETVADYGWLVEFNIDDCEAKASCLVVFIVAKDTTASTWSFALQYSGNFQSISHDTMLDPWSGAEALKISGHGIDNHTWLFSTKNSTYYDYSAVEEAAAKEQEKREAKEEAQAKAEEQKARAAFRAAPLPDQNTKPLTVVVEKTYLNTNIASGSPLGLWAEVRISSEDAKRLHDPVGVPKNLAWHLVPELAEGRLRFAIICDPNRKDCFKLSPGKTYTLELMSQYDSAGARGNLDKRFVRVNGVGVYVVGDYSSEVN